MTASAQAGTGRFAISVDGLSFRYGRQFPPALNNISLQVPRGQCFGLLGPNGAGKTTLLSILTGMLSSASGRVHVGGHGLSELRAIKSIGSIVPQDLAFYPDLTGHENLVFFAGLHGLVGSLRKERIGWAAAVCGLQDVLDRPADTYSGGLKRRLNLAIGLLNNPQILYLDEPTVGIDAQSRNFILEAIRGLKARGMTIVYTSHYMEEIQAVCDSVAIVDHGRVVIQSSLASLLDQQERILEVSLREAPDQQQAALLAQLGHCETEGKRVRIRFDQDRSLDRILEQIGGMGLQPRQIQYGLNRLEDIYLSLTKNELRDQ
ncbi:ABC transporter ATP-binding protein [Gilvimarinus sp. F26214L]|uniref:ABC transporter ATP-binding protein n=1 Tax=Gilvimarinus sp. DZF01 TaxID=3461371 RepID=UPI0040462F67